MDSPLCRDEETPFPFPTLSVCTMPKRCKVFGCRGCPSPAALSVCTMPKTCKVFGAPTLQQQTRLPWV